MYTSSSTIRTKVLEIIRAYRGLTVLGSQIKIESLNQSGDAYTVKGEYSDRGFMGEVFEEGTYEIKLSARDLNPISVNIIPRNKRPV